MRKPIIAANWKMHKTRSETKEFLEDFQPKMPVAKEIEVVIAPPFTSLDLVTAKANQSRLKACAQHCHYEDGGAFTGEVSPAMLEEMEVTYVIAGHSERRNIFGESNSLVNKKVRAIFDHAMLPILCIGESEEERAKGETKEVLADQVATCLDDLSGKQVAQMIIAYEPIWAIGTGESASPSDAQEGCEFTRNQISTLYDSSTASSVRIQYGGSIKPHNAEELMSQPDIDGGLIGSASLEPESFAKIISRTPS
ncbi:MAG: triose-phosphate isomerase [Candidatus Bipolaricaulota bacterium]